MSDFTDGLGRYYGPAEGFEDDDDEPLGTIRWFGRSWGAPVCRKKTHIETPAGLPCERCPGTIASFDQGVTIPYVAVDGVSMVAYHLDCWLQSLGIAPEILPGVVTIYTQKEGWLLPPSEEEQDG